MVGGNVAKKHYRILSRVLESHAVKGGFTPFTAAEFKDTHKTGLSSGDRAYFRKTEYKIVNVDECKVVKPNAQYVEFRYQIRLRGCALLLFSAVKSGRVDKARVFCDYINNALNGVHDLDLDDMPLWLNSVDILTQVEYARERKRKSEEDLVSLARDAESSILKMEDDFLL